jgi:hypothetical protein
MARFDCATWRPIGTNTGGRLAPNLGLVLHHAVANGSLYSFFNSPSAQVSAHFWVAQDGRIEQYVDTDVVAWHGMNLNSRYVGVETEGCSAPPHAEPMSDAMVGALANLYGEGMARHGWPNAKAQADGQSGFGFHRMAVNTACPCDVRLNRRDDILRLASGGAPPPSSSAEEGKEMIICSTPSGRGYICVKPDGAVFAYGDAAYHGGANEGHLSPGDRVTDAAYVGAGSGYWLIAKSGAVFAYGDAPFKGRPNG